MKRKSIDYRKPHFQYIIAAVFMLALAVPTIILLAHGLKSSNEIYGHFKTAEKVDGTIVGYNRYCGPGNVNLFWVSFDVEYVSEDGTKYRLEWYADEYKRAPEEYVKNEVGKTRPLLIDGNGNCIKGDKDETSFVRTQTISILVVVVASIVTLLNVYLLIWSISIVVKRRQLGYGRKK